MSRYVGLGKETTYGTPVSAARYAESIASIRPDQNWIEPTPVATRAFRKRALGPYRSRGSIGDFAVEPENIIGELLLATFGSVTTTSPATGVHLHVFTPADLPPSYTVRLGSGITERVLPGCLANSLTIKFSHDDVVKANAEIVSGFEESRTSLATPTISPLAPFTGREATSVLTIAGVSRRDVVYDLEINVRNNVIDRGDLSGRGFKRRFGQREVTGKLSAYFDDTAEYDRFIGGSEFTLLVRAEGPIITGTHRYFLELELRKCVYQRDAVPDVRARDEPLVIDAPFKAFFDADVGWEARARLQNTISGY